MSNSGTKEFELSPAGPAAKWFFAIIVLLPLIIIFVLWLMDPTKFAALPVWLFFLIIGLGPILLVISMAGVRNPKVLLGPEGMKVKVSFVNKTWALSSMDRQAAKVVNLETKAELKPRWKLYGAAMPGLKSGLFKLRNGERAHLYITNTEKVVYIPCHKGLLLLSMENPKPFIDYLQSL